MTMRWFFGNFCHAEFSFFLIGKSPKAQPIG
jgi:hypothetical protein